MKVAIVHDWMTLKGGAENVIQELLALYPQADIYCIVDFMPQEDRGFLGGRPVRTSFVQRIWGARKHYRSYIALMPIAVEQLDVTGYDLVISTNSAVAKGVITGPDQVHICYTFSPIRYAWDLQHVYLAEAGLARGIKSVIARIMLHYLRIWDVRTANGVDHFVANSRFIARRIRKAYGRVATVVYSPVDVQDFVIGPSRDDFYVTASRMVPYKRMPLIVEAFAKMPDRRLVVIGDGPDMAAVRAAAGPNVTVLGRQPRDVLIDHMQRAKAFVFAAEEDFGIVPLEAQACGTPVVAYGKGGCLETVRGTDGPRQTGVFFPEQSVEAIVAAVEHLDSRLPHIDPEVCRANACRFSADKFRDEMKAFVNAAMAEHRREAGYVEEADGGVPAAWGSAVGAR